MDSLSRLSHEEFEKYDKICTVIKNLIHQNYKNYKFDFIRNEDTLYVEIIIGNNNSKITILPTNTWAEITRHIDKKIAGFTSEDCTICCNPKQNNISCVKCSNDLCGECYINLFKRGKGIITCPHCRFSFGRNIPESLMELCIDDIRSKLLPKQQKNKTGNQKKKKNRKKQKI